MSTASERIPVLVTKTQKERLTARAKAAGLSTGEYLRRAGEAYRPEEADALLEGLLAQATKTTLQAERTIDEALAYVEASEKRISEIEADHGEREAA